MLEKEDDNNVIELLGNRFYMNNGPIVDRSYLTPLKLIFVFYSASW
jgi:hypothetical protein